MTCLFALSDWTEDDIIRRKWLLRRTEQGNQAGSVLRLPLVANHLLIGDVGSATVARATGVASQLSSAVKALPTQAEAASEAGWRRQTWITKVSRKRRHIRRSSEAASEGRRRT